MAAKTYDTVIDNKYKAGAFIGKQLIALDRNIAHLDKYNSNKIQVYEKGSVLGTVYGIFTPTGKKEIYWFFYDANHKGYYIMHDPNKVGLNAIDKGSIKTVNDYIDENQAEKEKEEKGAFTYYFERYGKMVLLTATALGLGYIYINGRNKN